MNDLLASPANRPSVHDATLGQLPPPTQRPQTM